MGCEADHREARCGRARWLLDIERNGLKQRNAEVGKELPVAMKRQKERLKAEMKATIE